MTNLITVNGHPYKAREIDFNFLCDLEDQNLSLEDIDRKPMSLIRAYLAFSANMTLADAGAEVEKHLESGGKFTDITDVMSKMMQESGFFRSISESTKETSETSQEEPKKNRKSRVTSEA